MPRSPRTLRASLALALTIWAEGCMAHRPVSPDMTLPRGSRVRVSSAVPFTATRSSDSAGTMARFVTAVEGRVRRTAGDTVVLERLFGVATSADGSTFRTEREEVTLVRTTATEVTLRKVDWPRTVALVGGITVLVIGFLAYAVSQIEFGFPSEWSLSR